MEIAHAQTKVLRVIGKLILLGLLVVLLAKVLLPLLVLAAVGLLTCLVARAVYHRRTTFWRILVATKERLNHCVTALFQTGTGAKAAAHRASSMLLNLAEILQAFIAVACRLLGRAARIGWVITWSVGRKFQRLVNSALVIGFRCSRITMAALFRIFARSCVSVGRLAAGAAAKIGNQSSIICGTFVEASSGALIGAMLALIFSTVTPEHPIEARLYGAALFGALLGITLGLSRTAWATQGESSHVPENQN
jgi:hypothetical protein